MKRLEASYKPKSVLDQILPKIRGVLNWNAFSLKTLIEIDDLKPVRICIVCFFTEKFKNFIY